MQKVSGWFHWGLISSVFRKADQLAICQHTCTSCVHVCTRVPITLIWTTLAVGWAHSCEPTNSQAVSSFVIYSLLMSYSLIKSLQLLIDQERTHPEWGWQHQAPGATLWEVCWSNQVLDHYICIDQIYPFTQAGFCAQKESRKVRSTKPREIKHEEGSKIPLVPMWTSHGCCKERLFSLPLPFLMALRVITWDTNSAHHLLLVPFKALLTKPDPDLSSLLLSSLEFEKDQVYLTRELFF